MLGGRARVWTVEPKEYQRGRMNGLTEAEGKALVSAVEGGAPTRAMICAAVGETALITAEKGLSQLMDKRQDG